MHKVILVIIDGYGYSLNKEGNAIIAAEPLFLTQLASKHPSYLLNASGKYVGLPPNQPGNSEVGHLTIGAGKIIKQEIVRINECIVENKLSCVLNDAKVDKIDRLHFVGLVSDGGVHSHISILKELLLDCKNRVKEMFLHFIADGRDTNPRSIERYFREIKDFMNDNKLGVIATIGGRFYGMDRNKNEDRIDKTFNCMTGRTQINSSCEENKNLGISSFKDKMEINNKNYEKIKLLFENIESDEFIEPLLLFEKGVINKEDAILFFNYRADRMKQLFKRFESYKTFTLTEFDPNFKTTALFKKTEVKNTLSELISLNGKRQSHIAETEKYAHVTYFFNGDCEKIYKNEFRYFVPSPSVEKYDFVPGMAMHSVSDLAIKEIKKGIEFIVINLAAPDMIGHTGNFNAAIEAVKITNECVKKIYDDAVKNEYIFVITADHGNVEQMIENGKIITKHTTNKVPLIICKGENKNKPFIDDGGSLKDVAPNILKLLGIKECGEMEGIAFDWI